MTLMSGGTNNCALGSNSGTACLTNTNGIFIGKASQPSSSSSTDEIVIGSDCAGKGSNTVFVKGKLYTSENVVAL